MLETSIEKQTTNLEFISARRAYPELAAWADMESARELGSVAVGSLVEVAFVAENETTLKTALLQARQGDQEALDTVMTNVRTDVAERLFKKGHVTQVWLEKTKQGLSQNGRRSRDIHKNAYQYMSLNPVMHERTVIEHRNVVFIDVLADHGVLDTHDVVVFEMTPHDQQTREEYRFSTSTDSLSAQYFSKRNQNYLLETAMVAGKTAPNALRHDVGVVGAMLADADIEVGAMSDNESVKHVLLLPKGQVEGVHGVVEYYDDLAGGTFYGENKPRQDYDMHRLECEKRSELFSGIVDNVVRDLLRDARLFKSPMEALERLDELSDKYCVQAAVDRNDIDLAVFGAPAAAHIKQARGYMAAGDIGQAETSLAKAHEVSTSSSCPTSFSSSKKQSDISSTSTKSLESSGIRKMTCPYCGEQTMGDPCASSITCAKCRASTRLSQAENRRRAKAYRDKKRRVQKGILSLWKS